MNPEQITSLLTLHANLQSTITRILDENAQLVEELKQPCDSCAARIEQEEATAAADLHAQRNRNRDESNAI